MEKNINKIKLPKDSIAENIETLSRKKFEALFDEERFILKPESIDNGVDYRLELKADQAKLAYGLVFQLKSTYVGKPNSDGSYSKSIETSNIEYLLNNGQPAYYGFYVKDINKFYFTSLKAEIKRLNNSNPHWQTQNSHTIRFQRVLDHSSIDEIYENSLQDGDLLRNINIGRMTMKGYEEGRSSLIISGDNNVINEEETIEIIEGVGMKLINAGRWKDIINLHKHNTTSNSKPNRYNLILGISYYYNGNFLTSLSLFKMVEESNLSELDHSYFRYYRAAVEHGVGYIDTDEFRRVERELSGDTLLGLYLKLTRAIGAMSDESDDKGKLAWFASEIESICNNPKATEGLKRSCRIQMILYQGYEMCTFYVQSVCNINYIENFTGPNIHTRASVIEEFTKKLRKWEKASETIKRTSWDSEDWFAYHHVLMYQAHIKYCFAVYTDNFQVSQDFPGEEVVDKVDHTSMMQDMLKQTQVAADYFSQVEFVENQLLALKYKHELEIYLGLDADAALSLDILKTLSYDSGSKINMHSFQYLLKGGTLEQQIKGHLSTKADERQKVNADMDKLEKEMRKYDEEDKSKTPLQKDCFILQFIPLGFFTFPKEDMTKVFNHINVKLEARGDIEYLISNSLIPRLNLFYDEIPSEGYLEKNHYTSTAEEWYRIYGMRRWFYEQGYLRKII